MSRLARLGVALLASYGAGLLGYIFVSTESTSWYDTLQKPFFTPPDWLFGIVWLVLYGCMAIALALMWEEDPDAGEVRGWVPLFFAHLLVNAAWTMFFFGFHAILIAFVDVLLLLACIILLICGAWKVDRRAAYLLSPYLAWVLFAAILNGAVWYLN